MTDRAGELKAAAEAIAPAALKAAKDAIAASCAEHMRWADLFSRRLDGLPDDKLHQFARAFALTMLGYLPTRPGSCPFCIQYGQDRSCRGCGYAAMHGRCDEDDSAFSLFIEAFQELGRAVYQDMERPKCSSEDARRQLRASIGASCEAAHKLQEEIAIADASQLMEIKAAYIMTMIGFIPIAVLSHEVSERCKKVAETLKNYW